MKWNEIEAEAARAESRFAAAADPYEPDALPDFDSMGRLRDRPTIEIKAGEIHTMATEAEDALIAGDAPFYVRGAIVRPVIDDVPASHGRRTKVARLSPVELNAMVDHLSRCAEWQKFDGRKKGMIRCNPPKDVAATVLSREGEWRLPRLVAVITSPTMRPDGTILSRAGYDAQTQLLLVAPPAMPPIPDKPTKRDAEKALKLLDALLDEFPFVDDAGRSVALSALITPTVRGALQTVPLHASTAPAPGSGKSFLWDLAAAINVGNRAPVLSAGKNEEETEKKLTAALLGALPFYSIDNVNGDLGGDVLCQIIERPIVSVRPLGVSELVSVESRACVFATGNNMRLVGDMTRRVIICALDPNVERPELRQFDKSPFDIILNDRGAYIAAALTIVRAYVVAGCPGVLPALASFEDWSRLVRSALVWLGREDPVKTMEAAREDDPETSSLRSILVHLHKAVGSAWKTTAEIMATAQSRPFNELANPDLNEALKLVSQDKHGDINSIRLGKYLARYKGRVIGNLKLQNMEDTHEKVKLWSVAQI